MVCNLKRDFPLTPSSVVRMVIKPLTLSYKKPMVHVSSTSPRHRTGASLSIECSSYILSLPPDYHVLRSLCEPSSRTARTKALGKPDLLRVNKTPTDGFTLVGFWRVSDEFCSHFLCRQSFVRRRCLLVDWALASSVWSHPDSCRGGFSDPCDRGFLLFQGHPRAAGLARCLPTRFIYNESL